MISTSDFTYLRTPYITMLMKSAAASAALAIVFLIERAFEIANFPPLLTPELV
jgi:hypothetical protein